MSTTYHEQVAAILHHQGKISKKKIFDEDFVDAVLVDALENNKYFDINRGPYEPFWYMRVRQA